MKQNNIYVVSDYYLLVSIFILWSIGLLVLPILESISVTKGGPDSMISLFTIFYVLLHLVIFYLVSQRLLPLMYKNNTHTPKVSLSQGFLYAYVLVALATSLYFLISAWTLPTSFELVRF